MADFATLVTAFFTRHLAAERNASGHTIAATATRSACSWAMSPRQRAGRSHASSLQDLTPGAILNFLDHLEQGEATPSRPETQGWPPSTRSSPTLPAESRPPHRWPNEASTSHSREDPGRLLGYLSAEEVRAILAAPTGPRQGRRDYLALAVLYDTGARDPGTPRSSAGRLPFDRLPFVRITGKGRKQRIVPLFRSRRNSSERHLAEPGARPGGHRAPAPQPSRR